MIIVSVDLDFSAWETEPGAEEKRISDTRMKEVRQLSAGAALIAVMNRISYADYFWQYDWEYQEFAELGDKSSDVISKNLIWVEMNTRDHGVYFTRVLKVERYFGHLTPVDNLIGKPAGDLLSRGDTVVFLPVGYPRSKSWLVRDISLDQVVLTSTEAALQKINAVQLCSELKWAPKGSYRVKRSCV